MIKRKSTPSYIYFNSIKVRLEPLVGLLKVTSALFQFHKGTIRTLFCKQKSRFALIFQFHKGTIRTPR